MYQNIYIAIPEILFIIQKLFKCNLGFDKVSSIGTIAIIYLSIKEGKEAFEKARGINTCNC